MVKNNKTIKKYWVKTWYNKDPENLVWYLNQLSLGSTAKTKYRRKRITEKYF